MKPVVVPTPSFKARKTPQVIGRVNVPRPYFIALQAFCRKQNITLGSALSVAIAGLLAKHGESVQP